MDDLKFEVLEPTRKGDTVSSVPGAENLVLFDASLSLSTLEAPSAASPSDPGKNSSDEEAPDLIALVAPFCDVLTLLKLALVSRAARAAATVDTVWRPFCEALGIPNKFYDPEELINSATPWNVLDLGYEPRAPSAYSTFCKAYTLLRPIISDAKQLFAAHGRFGSLNHLNKALLFANAIKVANVLSLSDDTSEAVSPYERQTLTAAAEEERDDLNSDLAEAVCKGKPLGPLLAAYDVWWQRLGLDDMRYRAVDAYFSKLNFELDAEDAFSFGGESNSKTASARKLTLAFQTFAAYLSDSKHSLQDEASGIPVNWRGFMQSVFFDRFARLVSEYSNDVLRKAEEISEHEYLVTVPKMYTASRSLMESDTLCASDDWGEGALKDLLTAYFLNDVVDDFCMRQLKYFEDNARQRVKSWTESVSERESETERFIWSSVPRKRDKTKFVTAFRWAVSSLNLQEDQNEMDNSFETTASDALSTPQTEFEAQTAVLVSKFRGMDSLVSLELVIAILEDCRASFHRFKVVERESARLFEPMFVLLLDVIGRQHIGHAFEKAVKVLNAYDPKRFGRLVISVDGQEEVADGHENQADEDERNSQRTERKASVVEPLVMFTELVNVGDLVQQMVHVFFEEELISTHLVRKSNFAAPSVTSKRKFEQMLDDMLAEGLSRGIDVLMDQVEFTLVTEQLGSDFLPLPTQEISIGPTVAATKVIDLVKSHLALLRDSTEKTLFDVFQQEVGMRLFTAISKHIKAQIVSVEGAVTLISDVNAYYNFMLTLKQRALFPYYEALKRVSQLYLVDTKDAKQLGAAVSDAGRYNGVIPTEELVEFVKRRQDWPLVRSKVERVLYGVFECTIT